MEFCDRCFCTLDVGKSLWFWTIYKWIIGKVFPRYWTHSRWQKRHSMGLIIDRMHTTCYTFLKIYFKYTPLPGSYFEMLLVPTCVLKYFIQNAVHYSILNPLLKAFSFLYIKISTCPLGFRKLTIAFMNDQNCKWL